VVSGCFDELVNQLGGGDVAEPSALFTGSDPKPTGRWDLPVRVRKRRDFAGEAIGRDRVHRRSVAPSTFDPNLEYSVLIVELILVLVGTPYYTHYTRSRGSRHPSARHTTWMLG
jgi:hypothetical protein